MLSQVTDAACPTEIVFYRHFQRNGSWAEDGVDGRLHVKMIQSSNDLPPPVNDQVKLASKKKEAKKMSPLENDLPKSDHQLI